MIDHVLSKPFQESLKSKNTGNVINIDPELRELIVAAVAALTGEHLIWVVGENENYSEKKNKLVSWFRLLGTDDVVVCSHQLPFEDPFVNTRFDLAARANKIALVQNLMGEKKLVVVTTLAALNIKLEKRSLLRRFQLNIRLGQQLDRDRFLSRVMEMGYQSKDFVEQPGDISWRGGIVDLFVVNEKNPVRIEFWSGEVKSIRCFNNQTQKSINKTDGVYVSRCGYFLNHSTLAEYFSGNQENMVTLPDLLGNVRIISSDFKKITHEYETLLNHFSRIRNLSKPQRRGVPRVSEIFNFNLDRKQVMSIDDIFDGVSNEAEIERINKCIMDFNQEDIKKIEQKIREQGYRCFVGSEDHKPVQNLEIYWGKFQQYPFTFPVSFQNNTTRNLFLTWGYLDGGERDIRFESEPVKTDRLLNRIKTGDYVVHKKHGIGKFLGIRKLEFNGLVSEFLKIEYQDREYLYVPVYELDVLNKYMAFEGTLPRIDRLGGKTWQSKQARARKSMVDFARDLLELYALRQSLKGAAYPGDRDLEEKLQQGFRFVETQDQKRTLQEVMRDLESEIPMDRLICGDVSFGKTEVALRAAFRVILSGRQVVMLCPTTILAWQHHETFKKRLADFPVGVAMLSRMVPAQQKRQIYRDLENGNIDMVIGTHSLITRDISFKDLGMVIIDEEQRFGVFQKEKLKRNREDIEVLILSATPIPRTLSLTLSGLQDLSTIQSAPIGRLAVKNYVGYFSKKIVVSAILNELERDGLVFLVYNDIEGIYGFQEKLRSWLPDVSMTVIHAKMRAETIEKNLMDFIHKKFRILISTTIIENGIDIPDVNTLIVMNADRFGLTQLYQLRGRIGRGSRQAYAFFLVDSPRISDKARSRLQAIREFADLGSGYKLAEFDLKLRGMGSLLGNRQHGHMEALGFDYYMKLLQQMIRELKGESEEEWEPRMKIHFPYSIDRDYISDSSERIRYYKKILDARRISEIAGLRDELIDRFGPFGKNIEYIFLVSLVRVMARNFYLQEVDVFRDSIRVRQSITDDSVKTKFRAFLKTIRHEPVDHQRYTVFFENFQELYRSLENIFGPDPE